MDEKEGDKRVVKGGRLLKGASWVRMSAGALMLGSMFASGGARMEYSRGGPSGGRCATGAVRVEATGSGRKCQLTGRIANNGFKRVFSNKQSKNVQEVNLQYKNLWWDEEQRWVRMRVCTDAIKTVDKQGLSTVAKKYGVNLYDFHGGKAKGQGFRSAGNGINRGADGKANVATQGASK